MANLRSSLRRMGRLVILGVLVVITIAIGIYYMQQTANESRLQEDITSLGLTLAKPMASADKLQEEYQKVTAFLAPVTRKDTLDKITSIASDSGIESDKLLIPPQDSIGKEKVGEGTYQVLFVNDITVQGEYENVMAFIANLEAREELRTLVIKRIAMSQVTVKIESETPEKTKTEVIETVARLNVAVYSRAGSAGK